MRHDRVLALHGQRLHYTEWGERDAPAVVLLHGLTGHCRTWDSEALVLASRCRVLALDLPGHGDSDPAPDGDYSLNALTADLAAFADATRLDHLSLVGLSLGGLVAIAYAATHPRRLARLVVVDIGPEIAPAGRARVGTLIANAPERFATVEAALALARLAHPRYDESRLRERVEHGLRPLPGGGWAWKYDPALREAVRAGRFTDSVDLWPLWAAIDCPTLLVRGAESDVLAPETARRMLQRQPRARLVEVPGAGHTVPGDQPGPFAALLAEFLAPSGSR